MKKTRITVALAMAFPLGFSAVAQDAPFPAVNTVDKLAALSAVTVTGTREKSLLSQTAASVGVISVQDITTTGPMHPQQILGQVPGVAVGVTNGEGHNTAIRHPFTTSPLYLFLEDGIPTRATGFFNHNALYEVNIPQAGGIEVVRGPGTALYGSDAIGGTVNILTKAPSSRPGLSLSGEVGSFGWRRVLVDGTLGVGADGAVRAAANLTHADGWRASTAYDRRSVSLRWDQGLDGGAVLKTILGFTDIDQETGANSALTYNDYINNPKKNNLAIAYRKVRALRMSTQYEKENADSLLTVTPYLRSNFMDLNGSYNLSFDPRIEKTDVSSLGILVKWRRDFASAMKPRLIVGFDYDHSPGDRTEDGLLTTSTGTGANRVYSAYTVGSRIYDYKVTLQSASVYAHGEISPTSALRLTSGLRYDNLRYDMKNNLAATPVTFSGRNYGQLASALVDYSHLSPKLGATYAINSATSLYTSYNHGFRAPSESQLFRAGSNTLANAQTAAQLALMLKPIKANQFEIGGRGVADGWTYDVVAYDLVKRDDLVSQRDLTTNVTTSVNAGKTRHRGIELGLGKAFARAWRLDAAISNAKHTYVNWVTSTTDFSGKNMEAAPRTISNVRMTWSPSTSTSTQLEWVHIGSYWLEASNSPTFGKYAGHDVLNLRASHEFRPGISVFGRLMNVTDRRYADSASVSSNTPVYSPALPRALYVGLAAQL